MQCSCRELCRCFTAGSKTTLHVPLVTCFFLASIQRLSVLIIMRIYTWAFIFCSEHGPSQPDNLRDTTPTGGLGYSLAQKRGIRFKGFSFHEQGPAIQTSRFQFCKQVRGQEVFMAVASWLLRLQC